jgi:hypothetical protein
MVTAFPVQRGLASARILVLRRPPLLERHAFVAGDRTGVGDWDGWCWRCGSGRHFQASKKLGGADGFGRKQKPAKVSDEIGIG